MIGIHHRKAEAGDAAVQDRAADPEGVEAGGPGLPAAPLDLSTAEAEAILARSAAAYGDAARGRVPDFIDRYFTLAGTLKLHRHALGADLVKAPANLALSLPFVASQAGAVALRLTGARNTAERLKRIRWLFETDVGRELVWLVHAELLQLPFESRGRVSKQDAIAETLLADPEVQQRLGPVFAAVAARSSDPAFRQRLERSLAAYTGGRTAAADIATAVIGLGTGWLAYQKFTPSMLSLGPLLAASLANAAAVSSFPLGTGLGALWYGAFPTAAQPALIVGATGSVLAAGAVLTAFAGVFTDPVQRRLGMHRRRLVRLVDMVEAQLAGKDGVELKVHDHYVARLMDLFEVARVAYQVAR